MKKTIPAVPLTLMRIFTLPEAAAYLNISPVHFLKLTQIHGVPTIDFGAHCKRWRRQELDALAKKCLSPVPSDEELAKNAKEMIHGRINHETDDQKLRSAKPASKMRSITISDIPSDLYTDLTNLSKSLNLLKNTLCLTMLRDSVRRYKNPLM